MIGIGGGIACAGLLGAGAVVLVRRRNRRNSSEDARKKTAAKSSFLSQEAREMLADNRSMVGSSSFSHGGKDAGGLMPMSSAVGVVLAAENAPNPYYSTEGSVPGNMDWITSPSTSWNLNKMGARRPSLDSGVTATSLATQVTQVSKTSV